MTANVMAKIRLNLPHNSKSGTTRNSIIFIVKIMMICSIALNLGAMPVKIQAAINTSEKPMALVSKMEYSVPIIRETIC